MPLDWCEIIVAFGVDPEQPGIYEWRIEGEEGGTYIGKYTRPRRPTKEYRRNVLRLLNQLPYRKSNEDGFRRIHRALEAAYKDGRKITLTILENVADPDEPAHRESYLIAERGNLNDPPFGRKISN